MFQFPFNIIQSKFYYGSNFYTHTQAKVQW